MNGKIAVALTGLLVLGGCIVGVDGGGGGGPNPGNITFSWTLGGQPCSAVPAVANVRVTIPGEVLQNNGVYACDTGGYDGIQLANFVGGTYSWTVDGLDSSGTVLYTASGTVNVDGDVNVNVDLTPVGGSTTFAYLSWTFPQLPSKSSPACVDVGVVNVDISIDSAAAVSVPCTSGQGAQGWQTPFLDAGTHTISLAAVDANGTTLYQANGNFQTSASQASAQGFGFQWAVGGLSVNWTWKSASESCAVAGISNLNVQLYDSNNAPQFQGAGASVSCDPGTTSFTNIPPGTYAILVTGSADGGTTFSTSTNPAPTVSVQAGVFPATQCTAVPGTNCVSVSLQ
jgi:hypothetical protein